MTLVFRYWRLALALALLVGTLAACSADAMHAAYLDSHKSALSRPASAEDRPTQFTVNAGEAARTIAANLQAAGLIEDERLFEAYVRVNGLGNKLEAGTYTLSPHMTVVEIAEALQHSRAPSLLLTVPEGWRMEEIAASLTKAKVLDGDEYLRIVRGESAEVDLKPYAFLAGRPKGATLEGYLYPDTYELPAEGATAADLVRRQLDTFAAQVAPLYAATTVTSTSTSTLTLTLHQVITLASIVEREAVHADERPEIAGVYLNRLARGIKLEADPTVQYAMGYQQASGQWWKTPVSLEEYAQVDSPYNTYMYPGLPPGPIANPGLSSIQAVLHPARHDYLYFVALPDGSGRHVFAATFAEHEINVRRYRGQ